MTVILCGDCGEVPAWSRGLCNTCYSRAARTGTLSDWPTQKFLDDPESHIRWAFGIEGGAQMIADIAVEYGFRLLDATEPAETLNR